MYTIRFTYNQNPHQQFEFNLQDQVIASNVQLLFNRQGEHLIVNEGRLQRVEGIRGHLSYYWNRREQENAVKEVIAQALRSVYAYLQNKTIKNTALILETLFKRMRGLRFGNYLDNDQNVDLNALLERNEGEHVTVIKGRITKGFCYNKPALREKVRETLTQLNAYFVDNEPTHIQKIVLKHIFTKSPLSRMRDDIYDRGAILEGSKLEEILAEIFNSDLLPERSQFDLRGNREALKEALKGYRNNENKEKAKGAIKERFMDLVLAEYAFSYQLGLDLKNQSGGSGGARYGRDRFGEKLVVVKPGDEGPHGRNNPRFWAKIKRFFVSPRSSLFGNSEPQSEVDSYLLSERTGLFIVPPTELRYIPSSKFKGDPYKECSVQMYIRGSREGPPLSLGKYLGINPKMHLLPRLFLRWFLDKEEILNKIPQGLAERLAAHNILIEDIDCHFDNVLVFLRDAEPTLFDQILENKNVDDEIEQLFQSGFFKQNQGQSLLNSLLYSVKVAADGKEKKLAFAKHDGGSSNPHRHPNGILEKRFKHFFEVHPRFSHPFTMEQHFAGRQRQQRFIEFLLEKGARALRNCHPPEVFKPYWNNPLYRKNFKTWILARERVAKARDAVLEDLIDANKVRNTSRGIEYRIHYIGELDRIHRSITTRIDSWKVLKKNLKNETPMRQALQVVTPEDFKRELTNYDADDIEVVMSYVQQKPVADGESRLQGEYFSGNIALIDLGEGNG